MTIEIELTDTAAGLVLKEIAGDREEKTVQAAIVDLILDGIEARAVRASKPVKRTRKTRRSGSRVATTLDDANKTPPPNGPNGPNGPSSVPAGTGASSAHTGL